MKVRMRKSTNGKGRIENQDSMIGQDRRWGEREKSRNWRKDERSGWLLGHRKTRILVASVGLCGWCNCTPVQLQWIFWGIFVCTSLILFHGIRMIEWNLFIVNCQLTLDLLVSWFTVWSLLIDCQWYDEAIGDDQIRLPGLPSTLLLHTPKSTT